MTISRDELGNLLSVFAETLKKMSDGEFSMLIKGEARLRVVTTESSKTRRKQESLPQELLEVARKLEQAGTREEAAKVISEDPSLKHREQLVQLATFLRVHVTKKDSSARIGEKIIESVVGAKMRSAAIKSLPF